MRLSATALLAAAAITATACSDTPTEPTTAESAVEQAYFDADSGYFDENPGGDDLELSPALTSASTIFSTPGDAYIAPERWGRRRAQEHPRREYRVVIEGDTAKLAVAIQFRGVLRVDTTFDGIANPGAKRMDETLRHRAVFVKDRTAARGWRLIGLSLGNIEAADPVDRTVVITSLSVEVNGTPIGTVTDPDQIFRLDGGVPRLHLGDSVVVTAAVDNTTGTDLVPPTQVFLHVRHHRANSDAWARIPMQDNGDGTWTIGWTVRRTGVARMAVDALDSETLQTQSGDNYRANIWAFPYRAIQ